MKRPRGDKQAGVRRQPELLGWLRPGDPAVRTALRREQAVIGRRMGPFTLGVSITTGALLTFLHWDEVNRDLALLWLALCAAPLITLLWVWAREGFDVPARYQARVLRRVPVTALVSGLLWAAAPTLLFWSGDPLDQLLLSIVIFSLTAASVVVLSGLMLAVWLFITPPLVAMAGRFLSESVPIYQLLGAMTCAYEALLMVGAYLGYRRFVARVAAQVVAREALATLEEALESIGDAFGLFDADGRPLFLNAPYRALFGTRCDDLKAGDDIIQQVGDRWLRSSSRRTASGKRVHVHSDVTALKQTEDALREARDAAEQASRAKSQFLATMSHELRTPLNAIIGFAEMLAGEDNLSAEKVRGYAATIRQAGRHLLALLNDILDLSRIEAGAYQLEPELVPLGEVAHEVTEILRPELRKGGLEMVTAVPADLKVKADERALRQVFLNLVGNAIKFTPAGGRITISARPAGKMVDIVVADTGEGIDRKDLTRILEPFVQGEDAMSRRHGGAGLGLPLVKRLVELHGGRFRLESERGRGTRAIFSLPGQESGPE